jgi:putative FmdB family regulatory protein
MPTYEYKCRDCGENFDEFQKITDPPLTKCNFCGGPVDRVISGGSGVMFKGSGFYITDYRSEKYKKDAQKDKSDSMISGSSSAPTTTPKPTPSSVKPKDNK